jgi:hypothetical protein
LSEICTVTIFGKVLLLLNFALSLLGFSWAVFVFVTPVVGPAKLKDYENQAKVNSQSTRDALTVRDRAAENLRVAELGNAARNAKGPGSLPGETRQGERDYYDAELSHLVYGDPTGIQPERKQPLRAIELDDKGYKLDPANGNRPKLTRLMERDDPAKPIEQPLEALVAAQKEALQALIGKDQKYDSLLGIIRKHIELTDQLDGNAEKKLKGLQDQLKAEIEKAKRLLQQVDDLRPLYVNSVVESELILRRQRALRDRYEELQKQPAGEK